MKATILHRLRLLGGRAGLSALLFGIGSVPALAVNLNISGFSPGTGIEEANTTLNANVTLSNLPSQLCLSPSQTLVNLTLTTTIVASGGTATAGQDFDGLPQTVSGTIGAQGGSLPFGIRILDDNQPESTETLNLDLSNAQLTANCTFDNETIDALTVSIDSISGITVNILDNDQQAALPPDGTIDTPSSTQTITAGSTVNFASSGTDPDNNFPLSFMWDFGGGATNVNVEDPGAVTFNTPGTYSVALTVTDAQGNVDPTPATITVIVQAATAQAPNGTIDAPSGSQTITAGDSITFAGSGADPDGNLPLSFMWNFGGGATNVNIEDPGTITFSTPGTYTVALTVTDAQGNIDPTPATVTITVQSPVAQSPDGTIDTPASGRTFAAGAALNFTGSGSDPNGNLPLSFAWDFGGGATNVNVEDPGPVIFNNEGTFIVTLTVTDAQGNVDPTPAMLTVTIGPAESSPVAGALQGLATTEPQRELAEVIEIVCPKGRVAPDLQRDCNNVVGSALATDPTGASQAANALAQLTPDQVTAPLDAAQTSINAQLTNVGSRLSALRLGARGFNIAGLNFNYGDQSLSGTQLSALYDDLGSGGSAGEGDVATFGRLGIFINGNLGFGEKDSTANEEGFDIDTQGLTLGADYRLSDNLVLGGALGYMNSEIDLDQNGGDLDSDGYSLTLYGTYYQSDVFYIDGSLSYGRNDYDQARNIQYTLTQPTPVTVDQTLSADYDGNQWGATIGAGYEFNQGALNFGPTARLEYLDVELDSYRESASNPNADGSGWTVAIDDQDFESLTMSLGGQATYALSFPWGVMIPQLTFEWVHEFEDDSRIVTGRFLGDPTQQTFQLPSDADDSNYFNLGLGASFLFTGGRTGYIYVRSVQGYEDLDYTTVGAGFRLEF